MRDIDVRIAHASNPKRLGERYNHCMRQSDGWVLFIDHDVLLLHPKWYEICLRAIKNAGPKAGFLTALTNRLGCAQQRYPVPGHDISDHTKVALELEKKNRGQLEDFTHGKRMSGHVILTNREAWEACGGFTEGLGICGTDTRYHGRIEEAGYRVLLMKDLYVYHRYERFWKQEQFNSGEWALK